MTTRVDRIREAIAASRAASEGATPGVWTVDADPDRKVYVFAPAQPGYVTAVAEVYRCTEPFDGADARHIAHHNPAAMAALLADLEAALAVVGAAAAAYEYHNLSIRSDADSWVLGRALEAWEGRAAERGER